MSMEPTLDLSISLQPFSQLEARPLEWLWPGRMAFGKLAIFDGDPGVGKSLLALDLCARLSTGRPFPDGSPSPGPMSSIVLTGEGGAHDISLARLQAMGADMERVFDFRRIVDGVPDSTRFPEHTHLLGQALEKTGARLVVFDPIMAFLEAAAAIGNEATVWQAWLPLLRLAEQYSCAMFLSRHLNKGGGTHAVYRGSGSVGISAACRSDWLVARDPCAPAQGRVLAETKNNLAAAQPSLSFTIDKPQTGPATITWLGACAWTANQLLAAARAPASAPALDRAREFLTRALEQGPRTSRELWALAQQQRLSRRTLRRAKILLKIRSVRVCTGDKRLSYWLLDGQQLPASVPPESVPPDLEEWLAPLREQFPPSTPLDDL